MTERWQPISTYGDSYEVSDSGRVRNHRTGHVLALHPDTCGYASVKLNHQGKGRTFNVHRLVADAFIGARDADQQIAHLDGNPANAKLTNLKIVSRIENEFHKEAHGRGKRNLTWREPTQSKTPHPADGMTQHVDCDDGAWMTIIDPRSFEYGGPEWVMRYGNPESIRFTVASILASYDYLLSDNINWREALRRLQRLRRARAECCLPEPQQAQGQSPAGPVPKADAQ